MGSHSVHCPEQKLFLSLQKQFCPFLTRVQSKGHAFTHCNNLTHNLGTSRKWGSSAACVSGAHLAGLLPSAPSLWRVRSASAHSDLGEHSDGRQSRDRWNRRAFHVSAGPGGSVLTVPQILQSPVTGAAGSSPSPSPPLRTPVTPCPWRPPRFLPSGRPSTCFLGVVEPAGLWGSPCPSLIGQLNLGRFTASP